MKVKETLIAYLLAITTIGLEHNKNLLIMEAFMNTNV